MTQKLCGCPCGTPLVPRKDGTFGNYIPGHDAKHKSILVNQAIEGSEEAQETLRSKGWFKYYEKAKASREKRTNRDKQKHLVGNRKIKQKDKVQAIRQADLDTYGLTDLDLFLIEFPPTSRTWICRGEHEEPLFINGNLSECWFCHKPATDELIWPQFEEALEKFMAVPWDTIAERAQIGVFTKQTQQDEEVQFSRKLLRLKRKHDRPESESGDALVEVHEAPSVTMLDYEEEVASA